MSKSAPAIESIDTPLITANLAADGWLEKGCEPTTNTTCIHVVKSSPCPHNAVHKTNLGPETKHHA